MRHSQESEPRFNKSLWITLGFSAVLHLLLFWLLATSVTVKKPSPATVTPVISARLVTQPHDIAPPPPDPDNGNIEEQIAAPDPVPAPVEVSAQETAQQQTPSPDVAADTAPPAEPTAVSESPQPSATFAGSAVSEWTQRHVQQLQQQQQQGMAQREASDYRRTRISPTLRSSAPVLSPEQALRKATTVRANCESGAGKSVALLSGLMGGVVQCSEPPPIEGFIQHRLNKSNGTGLPEGPAHEPR